MTTTEILHSTKMEWVHVLGTVIGAEDTHMKRLKKLLGEGESLEGDIYTNTEQCGKYHHGEKL